MKRKEMETGDDEHCQVTSRTLNLRMEEMLKDGQHSDVTFVTDDEMKIPAHRCVLVSVSPVFRAMFASPMIEETTRTVRITDMSSSCLRAFLRLLYTEELEREVSVEFGLHLLAACRKYQTPSHLIKTVSSLIGEMITVENSVTVYKLGSFYDDKVLLSCSKAFMFRNWKSVVFTPEFGELAVKQPTLQVELVQSIAIEEPIRSNQLMRKLSDKQIKDDPSAHKLWDEYKIKACAYGLARKEAYKALLKAHPAYKVEIEYRMAKPIER